MSNGSGYVRTAEYKKRVAREEEKVAAGEMLRVGGGELPVEAEERRRRPMLCMEDLRLALGIGDGYLGQVPILAGAVANARCLDTPGIDALDRRNGTGGKVGNGLVNGFGGGVNGAKKSAGVYSVGSAVVGDPMEIDEESAWQGGSVKEVDDLDSALDAVLELGDL
jgi:transcriptional coactivator HFI1/ADA1